MSEPPPPTPASATPPLSASDWAHLSALFDTACELPAAQWPAWLAQVDVEQPTLAPWLRDMLAAHAARQSDDWLERGPQLEGVPSLPEGGLHKGQRVGPWVLGDQLGSGGMATVWRASKADALPAREVALKLPLSHRAGSQLAERFAREQVILARLAHPHIATLYDAGVAADGTPWLAMECVEGQPIDQWCDTQKLGVAARVQLFMQVLDAVQYAHSRLVIHRDLKPSNMLVTLDGDVRLLDFGIAKLLSDDSDDLTGLTQATSVMTPAYAAPEQVLGQPLTTATDIYALGVVLFELLAGTRPYRLSLQTRAQLEVAVTQGQVLMASQAVTGPAALQRGTTRRPLVQLLQGDLDNILAKALQQDVAQRYASAVEFADDLRRWTQGEPVRARPASRAYRLRRFVQRNRVPVFAGVVVFAALVTALVVSLLQVQRASQQRDLALAQRGRGLALSVFLLDQLVVLSQEGKPLTVPAMLARAEANARSGFAGQTDELAEALFHIGAQRRNFESAQAAGKVLAEAKNLARDPDLRALAACDEAMVLYGSGQQEAALQQVQQAVAGPINNGVKSMCVDYQVLLEMAESDLPAALQSAQKALALGQQAPDLNRRAKDRGRMMVAYLQAITGSGSNTDESFATMQQSLREAGSERSLTGIELRSRWAAARLASGEAREALRLIEDNINGIKDQADSPMQGGFARNLGVALEALGRDTQAQGALDTAAARAAATGDKGLLASSRCLTVPILLRQGQGVRAQQALDEAAAALPASFNANARLTSEPTRACALARVELALAQNNGAAAQAHLIGLLNENKLPLQHRATALLQRARAALLSNNSAAALADANAALALTQKMQGQRQFSFRSAAALAVRGDALVAAGDMVAAQKSYGEAMQQFEGSTDVGHPLRVRVQQKLAVR